MCKDVGMVWFFPLCAVVIVGDKGLSDRNSDLRVHVCLSVDVQLVVGLLGDIQVGGLQVS